jgi:hypothetical protein
MLEIRIEIVPHGNEAKRKLLDKLVIINTGKHEERPEKGDYVCHHSDGSFFVLNHVRADGYWALVRKCIEGYLY